MSGLRRRGIATTLSGSSVVVVLLVALVACPRMSEGIWTPDLSCADTHGSHSPRPDTQMSCCSSATEAPLLAPAEAYSPRIAKHWSVALVPTRTPLILSSIVTRPHAASRPLELNEPALFLRHGSFLI